MARLAVIAVGSNLGDRRANLDSAAAALDEIPGVEVTAVSPIYRTAPVGGPDQGEYANAVVLVDTDLDPLDLLKRLHAIEAAHGRQRIERWGPRTLDLDLIAVGPLVMASDDLELPHPRAHERCFVLRPWLDVDPDAVIHGRGTVRDLLAVVDCTGVRLWTEHES